MSEMLLLLFVQSLFQFGGKEGKRGEMRVPLGGEKLSWHVLCVHAWPAIHAETDGSLEPSVSKPTNVRKMRSQPFTLSAPMNT